MLKSYVNGKSWEDRVIDYYNKKGYFTYKIPTMNGGTVFDIIAIHNGAALCIECKHITGSKLYYESSGLKKKTNEIEHFINTTGTNLYLYVKSDQDGIFWTTWRNSGDLLKSKGYLETTDMIKAKID
jgi:Holliday junction resolvase